MSESQPRESKSSMEDAGQSTAVQAAPVRSAQHARRKSLRLQEGARLPTGHAAPDHRARLDALGDSREANRMSNTRSDRRVMADAGLASDADPGVEHGNADDSAPDFTGQHTELTKD